MSAASKIAIRYIFSKRSFNFITVITSISILGIAAGTAALIAVLSIFNGFQELTVRQITGFDPHIRIVPTKGNIISNPSEITNLAGQIPIAHTAEPLIQSKVVATHSSNMQVFTLYGIGENYFSFINELKKSIIVGEFNFHYGEHRKGIMIGSALADRLGVFAGDVIELVSPKMIEASLQSYSYPKGEQLYVAGIFQTNIKDNDLTTGFVISNTAQNVFSMQNEQANCMDIRLEQFEKADTYASQLRSKLSKDYQVYTWKDLNSDLYQIMQFEKMASFSIIGIIIIIAVFNVLSSLAMTVTEKKQDIAIIKAIGATAKFIRNIYLIEGSLIGLIGTAIGTVAGLIFTFGQIHYKWFAIDGNRYIIDAVPVSVRTADVVLIILFSMFLSFLATIYPARKASKTVVAEAIRGE